MFELMKTVKTYNFMPSHTQFLGFTVLMLFVHGEILSGCLFYKQELSTNAKFCWVYVLNYLFSSPWYAFFLGLFCKELGNLEMCHSLCRNQGITHKHLLVSVEIAQTDPI